MEVVGQHAGAGRHVENGVLIDGAAAVVDRRHRLGRYVDRDVHRRGGAVAVAVGGRVAEAVGMVEVAGAVSTSLMVEAS